MTNIEIAREVLYQVEEFSLLPSDAKENVADQHGISYDDVNNAVYEAGMHYSIEAAYDAVTA